MKSILLSGCNGKMGKVIQNIVAGRNDCKIMAGFDLNTASVDFPVFSDPMECSLAMDVIIDFSHPSALDGVLQYAKKNHTPLVLATTGYTPEQVQQIRESANEIPVFFSANMSIGISLLMELAQKAARVLGQGFDIEIIEKHHNQKIDAPSGTALLLADAISEEYETPMKYEYDRHAQRKKRSKSEIGIHAVRGGTIVGEHEILFAGRDELISLTHTALSKEIFAVGAVNAALFVCDQPIGFYAMKDLVASK